MAEKILNSRITQKHDTEANWLKATNFKPMAGEVIIYDADQNYSYPRIKIGDGNNFVNDLPFAVKENMIINFSEDGETWTADKTHAEMLAAHNEGKLLCADMGGGEMLPLIACNEEMVWFGLVMAMDGQSMSVIMQVYANDEISFSISPITAESNTFVVAATGHIEEHKYSVNHTSQEIYEAFSAGKAVFLIWGYAVFTPGGMGEDRCNFYHDNIIGGGESNSKISGFKETVTIEGDVATWQETLMPNVNLPLTINGVEYDGSKAVEIDALTVNDAMPLSDIDAICGAAIYHEDEVTV